MFGELKRHEINVLSDNVTNLLGVLGKKMIRSPSHRQGVQAQEADRWKLQQSDRLPSRPTLWQE